MFDVISVIELLLLLTVSRCSDALSVKKSFVVRLPPELHAIKPGKILYSCKKFFVPSLIAFLTESTRRGRNLIESSPQNINRILNPLLVARQFPQSRKARGAIRGREILPEPEICLKF
ncbi:MAG: hypothetical protein JST85_02660 [Acidobacteria bacterium]|nr:hypothetical protein [Acidobacteriota bacterium]